MIPDAAGLRTSFGEALKFGHPIRIRYFTQTFPTGSVDSEVVLTQSGTDVYGTGVTQPIKTSRGTSIALLMEQGKLLDTDQILYVDNTVNLSGTLKLGIGSPVSYDNTIIPDGATAWNITGSEIYKKVIIRRLIGGSLYGE